jgi:hypothetical protein
METPSRLLLTAAGLIVIGLMAFDSIRYGVASTASANGSRELDKMSKMRAGVIASWWREDIARAVAFVPGDPFAREILALVIIRNTNEQSDFEEAQRHLVAAIEARPGSPYTWANLAVVKYRLGETGSTFEKALVNASNLGPNEAEVQMIVTDLGLAVYDEVQPATRAAIERMVRAGLRRNAAEILQISARRGRLGVACRHLVGVPRPAASKSTQLCQSMEATP